MKSENGQIAVVNWVVWENANTCVFPSCRHSLSPYPQVPSTVHTVASWPLSMLCLQKHSLLLHGLMADPFCSFCSFSQLSSKTWINSYGPQTLTDTQLRSINMCLIKFNFNYEFLLLRYLFSICNWYSLLFI